MADKYREQLNQLEEKSQGIELGDIERQEIRDKLANEIVSLEDTLATTLYEHAKSCYESGEYAEAIPKIEQALDLRSCLARDSIEVADCIKLSAQIYKKDAQYEKALPLYQEALDIAKKKLGNRCVEKSYGMFIFFFTFGTFFQKKWNGKIKFQKIFQFSKGVEK
jgi:tetratricopeptide (TPR) repeat protein